jgi:hypothetical protein
MGRLVVSVISVIGDLARPIAITVPAVCFPSVIAAAPLVHLDATERLAVEPTAVVPSPAVVHDHRAISVPTPPTVGIAPRRMDPLHHDDRRCVAPHHNHTAGPGIHHSRGLTNDHVAGNRTASNHDARLNHLR